MCNKKSTVLFVCLGNICRSPVCEGVCKDMSADHLIVESASTSSWHRNEGPDYRAQEICEQHGIDISSHRSRPIRADDWNCFDFIVALDQPTFEDLKRRQPKGSHANVVVFNDSKGIVDPYYGGRTGFQAMYKDVRENMPKFLKKYNLLP